MGERVELHWRRLHQGLSPKYVKSEWQLLRNHFDRNLLWSQPTKRDPSDSGNPTLKVWALEHCSA